MVCFATQPSEEEDEDSSAVGVMGRCRREVGGEVWERKNSMERRGEGLGDVRRLPRSGVPALEFLRVVTVNEDVKDDGGVAFAECEGRLMTNEASLVYAGVDEEGNGVSVTTGNAGDECRLAEEPFHSAFRCIDPFARIPRVEGSAMMAGSASDSMY